MPIHGCFVRENQNLSHKNFEKIVLNGEYDDGCGIPYSVKGGMHYGQLLLWVIIAVS